MQQFLSCLIMSARVLFWMSERRLQYVCKDQSQNSSNIKHDLLDAMFMIVMADFLKVQKTKLIS